MRLIRDIIKQKIEDYLENECCFRDYELYEAEQFGEIGTPNSLNLLHPTPEELGVALSRFTREGFGTINIFI